MGFFEQVKSWEILCLIGGLSFLGVYFAQRVVGDQFQQQPAAVVQTEGQSASADGLAQVEVLPIPNAVYTSLATDTKFKKYLTGKDKYVFLFTYTGCPYARAFSSALDQLFLQDGFGTYYKKHVMNVGSSITASCPANARECATVWVYNTCLGNLCIFNPAQRQVVVDHSQNAQQIKPLLDKYKSG